MSRRPHDGWPPLIVASEKPKAVWWRDLALTIVMWVLLAIMLEAEFELVFFGHYLKHIAWADLHPEPDWPLFFERLRPFVYLIIALVTLLAAAAVATVVRYFRALRRRPPPPLPAATQARRARMDETGLLAARQLANVVVHIAPDGTHRVETRQ